MSHCAEQMSKFVVQKLSPLKMDDQDFTEIFHGSGEF